MISFHTKVVGVTATNDDGSSRQWIISQCKVRERLLLEREPDNPYDGNAIAVRRMTGEQIGYLSRNLAEEMATVMDSGIGLEAVIRHLTGGEPGRSLGVNIDVYEMGGTKGTYEAYREPSRDERKKAFIAKLVAEEKAAEHRRLTAKEKMFICVGFLIIFCLLLYAWYR